MTSPLKEKPRPAREDAADGGLRVGVFAGQRVENPACPLLRIDGSGPAGDAAEFAGNAHGILEIAELVDELHAESLLAGEDASIGDCADVGLAQLSFPSCSDG